MQPGSPSVHEMLWRSQLTEQQLLQIQSSVLDPYRYVHPGPSFPHLPRTIYPSFPPARNIAVPNPSTNGLREVQIEILREPPPVQHQPSDEPTLPKLTLERLKSYIVPVDRYSNHEIDLPKELEPYFGKGWKCRYYHSTPAWGFIPPKGSGIRRADGFKALMARLEELDCRKQQYRAIGTTHSVHGEIFAKAAEPMPSQLLQGSVHLQSQGNKRQREAARVNSPTISIDHQGITIKKPHMVSTDDIALIQQRDEVNFSAASSVQSSTASSSPETVPDVIKTKGIPSTDNQDLRYQVTFETKSSQDEFSAGPPKKRFLSRNEHDTTSGIGLLAHVASML